MQAVCRSLVRLAVSLVLVALLAAAPAGAANLLSNPHFATSLAGWEVVSTDVGWSSTDVAGSASSGSVRAVNDAVNGSFSGVVLRQCVPVTAGTSYDVGFQAQLPAGQDRSGSAGGVFYFYASPGCDFASVLMGGGSLAAITTAGTWEGTMETFTAPAGSRSAFLMFTVAKSEAGGELAAHFDDAFACPSGACEDSGLEGDFFTDPEYPDFRFRVNLGDPGAVIVGAHEAECQPDTVCVSGALPGRSELFLRILGPRPNGYLWPTLVRFTPSRVAVEIEQLSTGERQVYVLDAVPPGTDDLPGLQDRMGFLP